MRLYATSQAAAQANADKAHAYLIASDEAYAASVAAGQTVRWAVPARDVDADGNPVGEWFIAVEPRCLGAFTDAELSRLDAEGLALLGAAHG